MRYFSDAKMKIVKWNIFLKYLFELAAQELFKAFTKIIRLVCRLNWYLTINKRLMELR